MTHTHNTHTTHTQHTHISNIWSATCPTCVSSCSSARMVLLVITRASHACLLSRVPHTHEVPSSVLGLSIYFYFFRFNCERTDVEQRGCSSNGRARASHARGIGIDILLLQYFVVLFVSLVFLVLSLCWMVC
jgi:hypothetical protein